MNTVRILLVEDSEFVAGAVQGMFAALAKDAIVEIVETLGCAFEKLGDDAFDAIILDLALPDSAADQTLSRVRQRVGVTPIIVLTGGSPPEVDRSEANDWIEKGTQTPLPEVVERVMRLALTGKKAAEKAGKELDGLGHAIDSLRSSLVINL